MNDFVVVFIIIAALFALVMLLVLVGVILPYFTALRADAPISLFEIIGMRLRGLKVRRIVRARIAAARAGIDIPASRLEVHMLMGGDPGRAVELMVDSERRGRALTWDEACRQDLGEENPARSAHGSTGAGSSFDRFLRERGEDPATISPCRLASLRETHQEMQKAPTRRTSLLSLWIQTHLSNAGPLGLGQLIRMRMRMRNTDIVTLIYSRIRSVKAGMPVPFETLEAHSRAGGHIANVVSALIASRKARVDLTWDEAAAMDLAGDDVRSMIQELAQSPPGPAASAEAEPRT